MLIFGFFCISFGTSIFLKTEHAPDEAMRMLIPEYIVSHHTLPNGMEESVRHPLWGFSYALYPYLTAIITSAPCLWPLHRCLRKVQRLFFNCRPPHQRPFRHRHTDRCLSDRRRAL